MAAVTLPTLDMDPPGGLIEGSHGLDNVCTAAFTIPVFAQLFNCFNARSESAGAFHHLSVNPRLWGAGALLRASAPAADSRTAKDPVDHCHQTVIDGP